MALVWHGPKVQAAFEKILDTNLKSACSYLVTQCTNQMNPSGAYGLPPADEGTPPHKVSGRLAASVFNRATKGVKLGREVGSNTVQGIVMELGAPSENPGVGDVRRPVAKRGRYMSKRVSESEGIAIMAHYNPMRDRKFPRLWSANGRFFIIWGHKVTVRARPWLIPAIQSSADDMGRILATGF